MSNAEIATARRNASPATNAWLRHDKYAELVAASTPLPSKGNLRTDDAAYVARIREALNKVAPTFS